MFFTLDKRQMPAANRGLSLQAADSPHLLSVPVTWVKEGGMVRLNKKYLQVDYKGVSPDDVVYTIHTQEGHPKYGSADRIECLHQNESQSLRL